MKKRDRILLAASLSIAWFPALRAQDFTEYIQAVEQHNAAYLAERYQVDIAEAQTEAAKIFNDP